MNNKICRFLSLTALLAALSVQAADMSGVIKAQVILGQITQVVDKYAEVQAQLDNGSLELDVAEPIAGSEGKFYFPYDSDGYLTPWAEKALNAQMGAEAASMAADKATGALVSKIPMGGLFGGAMKGKMKETGAVAAIGGWDFIAQNTSLSFNSLEDMSVYMHSEFYGDADYEQALAAATAIYPKLESGHKRAVDKAYKDARKQMKKK